MKPVARNQLLTVLGLLASALVAVTCTSALDGPQQWSEEWGPLVPHKTFPGDCSLCHVPENWTTLRKDFSFDHAKQTGVALRGAHAKAACLRCHNDYGPVAEYVARGCAGCHTDIHESQLGTDCTRCHDEGSWLPRGLIAEHARTRFPLVGRHAVAPCIRCHQAAPTGEYRGAPLQCAQCHREDLARALAPDHQALGWTQRCERCHIPTRWGSGAFTHGFWPLTGQHAVIGCNACHTSGGFSPLPRDCYACHQDKYASAPNHTVFPTSCQDCHNTITWKGAVFNHTFPLSGPHRLDCSACHTGPDPRMFTCFSCHEHNQTDTDEKHKEVKGYTYAASACFQCHPNGKH